MIGGIMKPELVSNENNKVVFTVEISPEEFEAAISKVYKETRNQFSIQGFRKGKAPRKLIEANYGKEIFYEDALNEVLNDVYGKSLEELDLDPIDYPEVDVKDEISNEKPFTVEFTVQLMPEAKLKDGYKDAKIDLLQVELQDSDVDKALENEREKNSRLVEVTDRKAEKGDIVNIDYEGFQDGEAFQGGKDEGFDLELGSSTFIPGFEEGLIGVESGQDIDVNVTFPEAYQEDLAGKDAVFKVKVNSIKTKELPELDDDFAMDISEFDTLEEYKADLKSNLEKNVERNNKNESYNKAIEALVEYLDVEIPEVLINNQVDTEVKNFEQSIRQMGLDLDSYYNIVKTDEASMRKELEPQAIARLKSDFVLQALADIEAIEASEEEIDEEIRKMGVQYQVEDVDKFVDDYKKAGNQDGFKDFVIQQKALDRAVEIVNFNIVDEYENTGLVEIEDEASEKEEAED